MKAYLGVVEEIATSNGLDIAKEDFKQLKEEISTLPVETAANKFDAFANKVGIEVTSKLTELSSTIEALESKMTNM